MHRDHRRYGSKPRRGLRSKEFVNELHEWGLSRENAIVVVSQAFGVTQGAARLFDLSHPTWREDEVGAMRDPWDC